MIGRIIGGVMGAAIGRQKRNHPVAGAVIGAATMFAARRMFPARYAALAATAAAGYLTKKWAERREAEIRATEANAVNNPPAPRSAPTPPGGTAPATSASAPAPTPVPPPV